MRVFDLLACCKKFASYWIKHWRDDAKRLLDEMRSKCVRLRSRRLTASVAQGWTRGIWGKAAACRYVVPWVRRLRFESLERRAMLGAGDVYTFDPYATAPYPPNFTWSTSTLPQDQNWIGPLGQTCWQAGGIADFNQVGAYSVTVSGTVQAEGITFGGGGSTTLNPGANAAISFYETNNNLTIDDLHPEHPDQNVVTNDFINCPITAPAGSTGALVKEDPGDVAIGSTGNSPPGGVLIQGGSLTIGHNTFASTATITVDTGTGAGSAALAIYDTSSSSVTIGNPLVFQAGDLRVDTRGYQVTFSGSLTSPPAPDPTGSLVISDTAANGTFTATGDTSNFRGNVTIISGSLVLTGGATIGTGDMTVNGGRLDLGSTDYVPPATLSFLSGDIAASSAGYIDLSTPGTTFTTDIQAGEDGFISAPIEGSGNLEVGAPVGGSGLLFLLGDDTYTGTTTIDTGASLIYRWNGRNGEYSIPGGYGTAVVQTGATLKSEYAYFTVVDPNAYIWNGDSNGIWENDNNNTDWYGYIATDPLVNEGPAPVYWVGSGRDAVFEEPVPGGTTPKGQWSDIMIEGLVQLDGHLTFMMGSNVIISSGGSQDYLCFGSAAPTLLSSPSQGTTQWLYAPLACQSESGGLKMINPGNLYIGFNNLSRYQYFGTTTLTNADAIQFVGGGLGGDGTGDGSAPVVIDAGPGGTAGFVPSSTLPVANSIEIASGSVRVDPAGQQVTLQGVISGAGTLLIGDSVGGGTVILDPRDANEDHTVNTWTGGTNIQDGILNVSYDTDLGQVPLAPIANNIEFTGDGGLQWGASFALDDNRGIQIDAGPDGPYTATFDTNGNNNCEIDGDITGPGNLTVTNSSTNSDGNLELSGTDDTFTGVTIVQNGQYGAKLTLENPLALQDSTFDTSGAGTLSFDSLTSATFGGLQGSGDLNLENTPSAAVTLTVAENNSATTLDGSLTGSGSLVVTGTYVLTLYGQDPFGGTLAVSEGILQVYYLADNANGTGTITLGAAGTSGTLQYIGPGSETSRGLDVLAGGGEFDDLGGPFTFESTTGSSINASGNLTLGGAGNLSFDQDINVTGGNLTVAGSGYVSTSAEVNVAPPGSLIMTNSYYLDLGGTDSLVQFVVDQGAGDDGVVIVDSPGAFTPDMTLAFDGSGSGEVQLSGNSVTLGGLTTNAIDPEAPVIENSPDPYPPSTLTLDTESADIFAGTLEDGPSGDPLSLVVNGTGSLTLTGANSYSAGTTVTSGTLVVTAGNSLPSGTALMVGTGGTFVFDPQDQGEDQGSQGGLGQGQNQNYNFPPAVVAAIQCVGSTVVDANSVQFLVGFDKTVTGVTPADFGVVANGPTGGTVASVSGPDVVASVSGNAGLVPRFFYTVTVSGISGAGTLGLQVLDNNTITDLLGTPLDVTTIPVDQQYTIQATLYWPANGSGDWATGQWQLAGTPTPWIDGSSVVIAAGSNINLTGVANVSNVTVQGDATISGGTLALPALGSVIDVLSGTTTISSTISGAFTETGPGTLVLDGPVATPPLIAGGQVIGPGAVFSGNESLYAVDPAMFGLVQSLFVNHQGINRADIIEILGSAAVDDAVTDDALAALEIITSPQGEAALNMPSYVGVLASDVVNGNPANANYQGQPLGNLADQGSGQAMATALEDLVGKWFYGTDLPAIDPSSVAAGATYSVLAGSLFGNAQVPSSADMEQGNVGDCYFVAAVGAIADSDPTAIESMFTANGVENGIASYTVRFYYYDPARGYVPDYVTVNTLLPVWANGNLVYDRPGPDGSLWLPLLEKAYAQWDETGNEGRSGVNSYAALNDGFMEDVDAQVLGAAATLSFPAASDLTAKQALIAALQAGAAVTVGCFSDNSRLQLVGGHAYDVAGYDATTDSFMLENPWGFYEPCPLSWEHLCQYCDWLVVADASGTVPFAGTNSPATGAAPVCGRGDEIRAAALETMVDHPIGSLDTAFLADVTNNAQSQAAVGTQEVRIRAAALEMVLAESGR